MPAPAGSKLDAMTIGIVCVARVAASAARVSIRHDHLDPELNELDRQIGEPFSAAVGRAVLDHQVLILDVSELSEPLSEGTEVGSIGGWLEDLQHTDTVNLRRRLRSNSERPSEDAPTHRSDELSTIHHSITWSARTRMDRRIVM